ncbi:hypothetical protein WJX77_010336 [Trebouxia sp. C0004]
MNTSIALFNGLNRAARRTFRTGTLRPGRALAIGLRRPFSTILGMLPGLPKSRCTEQEAVPTESFTKAVGLSVAVPTLLAVVRLHALVQRIDLAVQAKDELLSEWVVHLVTGGSEKQLAGIMMQAEADLDELILAYCQRIGNRYKVVGACTGLASQLWAIMKGGDLPALMSHLVPDASCAVAMGLLGLDLSLPGSLHAQEVAMAAHDLQQLEEALTLAAAPKPAAPIRASPSDISPAVPSSPVKDPSSPQSLIEGNSPVSPMTGTGSAEVPTAGAAEAAIVVVPAVTAASQHVPTTDLIVPAPTDAAAAKATTGQGQSDQAISSEANAQPSTHAPQGLFDNRAAADSPAANIGAKAVPTTPVAKIKARATPHGPAAEFPAAETIAAKHAAGSTSTMPKSSDGSSSAQAKPERQVAKSRAAAQTASSAAAATASPPIAQSDIQSAPAPTAAAGSANIDAAASAVNNPSAVNAAAPGSSLYSFKADGSVAELKLAGNKPDPVHAPISAIDRPDHADATVPKPADDPASSCQVCR